MLLLVFSIMGCQKSSSRKEGQPRDITLAYTTQHDCVLVHVAMAKGYFAQEGLHVRPMLHAFGKAALDSVIEGKADLATVAETPVMFAVLNGEPIAIVASIFSSNKNNAIVADKERGISVPRDLRGKRIGFTPGTTSEFFLDSFLTANNIGRHDVTLLRLNPDEMGDAITANRVDAVSTWNPALATIIGGLGTKGTTFFDFDLYHERFVLAGRQEYVQKNAGTVQSVLRAIIRAEQFAAEHTEEAQAVAASSLKMDRELMRALWSESEFRVTLDQALLITLEDETRWAIKNHMTTCAGMPNYLGYIYFDGLETVNPDAVTIKR